MEDKIENGRETVPGGLVWIGSKAQAERLILEKKMKAPPHFSSWLQGTMNHTSQCPKRAVTPGISGHGPPSLPGAPVPAMQPNLQGEEETGRKEKQGPRSGFSRMATDA